MKVFIAGPRKVIQLHNKILERLNNIIEKNMEILVGDANGIDKAIQNYLASLNYREVTVYCVNNYCRNNIGSWKTKNIFYDSTIKDFKYYTTKDYAMARDTDYGFMIWNGKSKGTLNNIISLLGLDKKSLIFFIPTCTYYTISNFNEFNKIINFCDEKTYAIFKQLITQNEIVNNIRQSLVK